MALLHEGFAAAARRRASRPALVGDGVELSYGELDARSSALALRLREEGGVRPGALVALRSEPEAAACVAILAILKAGAAYLPLDPADPRALDIVRRARPALLLGEPPGARDPGLRAWPLSTPEDAGSGRLPPAPCTPDDVAYVPFTSGSTGLPKGVLNSHRACLGHARAFADRWPLAPDERWCLKASLTFVDSIYELFGGLLEGAPVVVAGAATRRDPERLLRLVARHRVTRLIVVPALLDALLEVARPGELARLAMRLWIVSGDRFHPALVERFRASAAPGRLLNLYGCSEAPGTLAAIDGVVEEPVPIGTPLSGVDLSIRDERLRRVPDGEPGEVCLGGRAVAHGYLGAPAATAEAFRPDPCTPGARLYRTGDIGLVRDDGSAALLGRRDGQVKVRGHRVELREVESALLTHPGVRDAVAVKAEGRATDALVAWCRAAPGRPPPAEEELRAYARGRLPEYMRPTAIRVVDELPKSANGKVDRRRIARAVAASEAARPAADGVGLEVPIVRAWRELLGQPVGPTDDVFELGADSLLATRVAARLRHSAGIEVSVRDVFVARSARALAARARAGGSDRPPLAEPEPGTSAPLSYPQRSFWFMDQLAGPDPAHAIVRAFRLRGPLDPDALRGAVEAVVERQDALRTAFATVDGDPVQAIARVPPEELWRDEIRSDEPFDLEQGRLVRFALTPLGDQEHLFAVALHHICADDWSLELLFEEISRGYGAVVGGEPGPPPPEASCRAFARWQEELVRRGALDHQLDHWRARLRDAPAEELFPRAAGVPRLRIPASEAALRLPADAARGLEALARRTGATLQMALLAAYAAALARWSGRGAVAVGIPVSGRTDPRLERTIGCFANTVAFRAEVNDGERFESLLERVRETCLDDFANGEVPFERVVAAVAPRNRGGGTSPLYQAMFGYQSWPDDDLSLDGVDVERVGMPAAGTQVDLDLAACRLDAGLDLVLRGNAALFERERLEAMVQELAALISAAASCTTTVRVPSATSAAA